MAKKKRSKPLVTRNTKPRGLGEVKAPLGASKVGKVRTLIN